MKRACIRKTLNEATAITDSEDMPEPSEGQAMTNARQAVTDSLEDLIKGIQRVLNYYNSTNSSNPLDVAYVCGAGGSINGISHLLSNELGLKVTVLRKLENVAYSVLGDNADLYNYVASIGAIYAPVGFFSKAKANKANNNTNFKTLSTLVGVLAAVLALVLVAKGFIDKKTASDENAELKATEQRYLESERVYNQFVSVLAFYTNAQEGVALTQRASDNIANFIEELEQKMPSDFMISGFSTDDNQFTMDVSVSDKNTAIGVIETLRDFNSIKNVYIGAVSENKEVLQPEEGEKFEDCLARYGLMIDENGILVELEDADAENAVVTVDADDISEDGDDGFVEVALKKIGTYSLTVDPETGDPVVTRNYVTFSITCMYDLDNIGGED
jgi:uncharacterized FlaG/YvyC family protein